MKPKEKEVRVPPVMTDDIWHPGEQKFIKRNGKLTEFGKEFYAKYSSVLRKHGEKDE